LAQLSLITKPEGIASTGRNMGRRERLEKRFQSAKSIRDQYDPDYAEIERLCLPGRVTMSDTNGSRFKRRANTSKQDTAGIIAGRTLVHGMATGMSSAARPWFKLTTGDPDLDAYQPVKEWLYDTEQKIYAHFASTNYYDAAKVAYSELAHMGFAVTLAVEHSEYGAVYHAFDHGEVWIAEDDGLRVSSMFYKTAYSVDQMVRRFPWANLSKRVQDAYNKGNIADLVPVMCVIEKNDDRDADKLDVSNKPWRSCWWEVNNNQLVNGKKVILKEGGFDSKPFTAPRWETMGSETYSSSSPGFNALADLRELEFAARRKGRAMDMMVRPPVFLPAGLQQQAISLDPGSLNFINDLQGKVDKISPDPNVGSWITDEIERLTRRVNQLFYADLWMAVTEMEGIQPRNQQELMYRNEEKLTQLGPVVDRVNVEKLEVDIDRAFSMLSNFNMLLPAPSEMQGKALRVNFVSILAQAQLATSNSSIERAAQFVGYLTGMYPEAAIKFDAEEAIDEFARNSHTNPKIIRSDEIVAEMKEQMAARQQQQQIAAMAPAAAQGAQAAELLSRTQVSGGGSMLDQMMGQ
jgi:hypothetical protein